MLFRKEKKKSGVFENRVIFRDWKHELAQDDFAKTCEDPVLSTLVSTVNVFGKYSFDTEDTTSESLRRQCGEWVETLLADESSHDGDGDGTAWRRLTEFFVDHRKAERRYVGKTLGNFKNLVWDFIRQATEAVSVEREVDGEIRDKLMGLKTTVDSSSILEIRREVLEAAQFIGRVLEEREKRQVQQMRELGSRLREMRAELTEAKRQLSLDPLTRVHNRSALDHQLERIVQFAHFSGTPACLLMVDADGFKSINDTYGHQFGDAALRRLAAVCVKTFPRESDFIARYGGDEFVVIIDDSTPQVAERLAVSLLERIQEERLDVGEDELTLTISIGLASLRPIDKPQEWLNRADEALRIAKSEGRNRVVLHDTLESTVVDHRRAFQRPACQA